MRLPKKTIVKPTMHGPHLTSHFRCLLEAVMASLLIMTSAQVSGQTACVPLATVDLRPSFDTLTKLSNLERFGQALGFEGRLSRSCSGELTGPGAVASPGYPCQPRWHVNDTEGMITCVWRLNTAPAAGGNVRGDLWRVRLDHLSLSSDVGSVRLLAFEGFPPTGIRHVNLADPLSDNYLNFRDAATVVLISTGRDLNRTQFLLTVSTPSTEVDTYNTTPSRTQPTQGVDLKDSTSIASAEEVSQLWSRAAGDKRGKTTCTPMMNATHEVKQLSEETTNLYDRFKALFKGNDETALNLTRLEELRGSGWVISRNYPCDYLDLDLYVWVLYAKDVPANSSTSSGSTTVRRSGRTGIRLRFVSFVTEPTYDQLLVSVLAPPPKYYSIKYSLSGNLTQNYTIELDSELVVLIFTASKATTASGFMIDFTTVVENDGEVMETKETNRDQEFGPTHWSLPAVVSLVAAAILGSAIVTCVACKRRFNKNREKAQKSKESAVAYSTKHGTAAYINQAMQFDVISKKDGLVFGGSRRPEVLLIYSEDDRTHCAVIDSLAQILRSFGGCDVSTISATQHFKNKQSHVDWSSAIGCGQLTSAAMQADRIILFASRGADLVEEAFISGKVYPKLYKASAAYLAIPHVMQLCTTCSAVRDKTLVVVYNFREDGGQNDVNDSAASSDGTMLSLPRSTIIQLLGAKVPEFQLPEQISRLVAALHGATPAEAAAAANSSCAAGTSCEVIDLLLRAQASIIWSCSEEYEESNERRQLISCVAAVEQSGMQGLQGAELFEAAHGPAVDWLDQASGFVGSVWAMRLSFTAESYQLSTSGLTDVVTLPSLAGLCASSDSGISEQHAYADYGGSSSVLTKNFDEHIGSDEVDSNHTADVRSSVQFS